MQPLKYLTQLRSKVQPVLYKQQLSKLIDATRIDRIQVLLNIKVSQWQYYRHWLILVFITEVLMLVFNGFLAEIYILIAVLFLGGFVLRLLRLYPGEAEPLYLDLSAVVLAGLFSFLAALWLDSNLRFMLILCSSVIIVPHFVFIAQNK